MTELGASVPATIIEGLAVRRIGRGRPVICLHAIGHDSRDYDLLASRLCTEYEFILVDWPGHGSSPPDTQPPDIARYGALLDRLMRALALDRPIVMGNSIGGAAAIQAAAAEDHSLGGVVLCNSAGLVAPGFIVRLACQAMARRFAGAGHRPERFAAWYRLHCTAKVLPAAPPARREQIILSGPRLAPLISAAWESFARSGSDLRGAAVRVRCPVLIAWARGDRVNPWRFSKAGAARFSGAQIAFFAGGHAPFLEDLDAFVPVLRAFVSRADTA